MKYTFADWQSGAPAAEGWDCADACADGWTGTQLYEFMKATVRNGLPDVPKTAADPDPSTADPSPSPPSPQRVREMLGEPVELSTGVSASPSLPPAEPGLPILDPQDPMPSARRMIAAIYTADSVRTLHSHRGAFHLWTGSHYSAGDHDAVTAAVWRFLGGAMRWKDHERVPFKPNSSRVSNVFAALAAVCNLPASTEAPTWLDDDGQHSDAPPAGELLAVKNGLLHLPTGWLHAPTPRFFNLNSADVVFDPNSPEPVEWLRFLGQIWPDDRLSIETLQDLFGYLISPDTSQQKIALIVGPKRSGKGTIARVLTAMLGHGSVAAPTLGSLATNFGLAPLIGKSVSIVADARLSSRADQAVIVERLLSISGEDSLTIDRKFLPAWTGRLPVRFVLMTNELPRLADASGALASRFIVLTMERSFFGQEDRGLLARLLPELPSILNWAREGYLRLQQRGCFLQPDSACDALDELEALGSPVAAFVKVRCTVAPGRQCRVERLFEHWKSWCTENGRKEPGTAATFGRDLRAVVSGLRLSKPRIDGRQVRYYDGIDITTSDDADPVDW